MRRVLLHAIDDGKGGGAGGGREGFQGRSPPKKMERGKTLGTKVEEEEATFFRCCLSLPRRLEIGGGGEGGGRPLWNLSEELG